MAKTKLKIEIQFEQSQTDGLGEEEVEFLSTLLGRWIFNEMLEDEERRGDQDDNRYELNGSSSKHVRK